MYLVRGISEASARHQRGNSEERAARVAHHRCLLPAANSRQRKQFFPCRIPPKRRCISTPSFEPLFSLSFPPRFCLTALLFSLSPSFTFLLQLLEWDSENQFDSCPRPARAQDSPRLSICLSCINASNNYLPTATGYL